MHSKKVARKILSHHCQISAKNIMSYTKTQVNIIMMNTHLQRSGIKQRYIPCYKYFNELIVTENTMKHSCDRFKSNNSMNVPVPSTE